MVALAGAVAWDCGVTGTHEPAKRAATTTTPLALADSLLATPAERDRQDELGAIQFALGDAWMSDTSYWDDLEEAYLKKEKTMQAIEGPGTAINAVHLLLDEGELDATVAEERARISRGNKMKQPSWEPAFAACTFAQSDVYKILAEYIEPAPDSPEGLEEIRSGLFLLRDGRYLYLAVTADAATGRVSCDEYVDHSILSIIADIHPLDLEGFRPGLIAWICRSDAPPTCPVCGDPAHASESDDNDVHADCQEKR